MVSERHEPDQYSTKKIKYLMNQVYFEFQVGKIRFSNAIRVHSVQVHAVQILFISNAV